MLMAESLNVANGQEETDSSSFQLPPAEKDEEILFSNTDFDEPMYCTSRPQSRKGLQHADCSSNDMTSVDLLNLFNNMFQLYLCGIGGTGAMDLLKKLLQHSHEGGPVKSVHSVRMDGRKDFNQLTYLKEARYTR